MKLSIRKARPRDLPALKRLTDEYLAEDYYSVELLDACIRGDRNLFYVVTDADRGGEVISYFYAFLAGLDEALAAMHVKERPEALAEYDGDTLVGEHGKGLPEKRAVHVLRPRSGTGSEGARREDDPCHGDAFPRAGAARPHAEDLS